MTDSQKEMKIGDFTLPLDEIEDVDISRDKIKITDTTGASMTITPTPNRRKVYMEEAQKFKEAVDSRKESDQQ